MHLGEASLQDHGAFLAAQIGFVELKVMGAACGVKLIQIRGLETSTTTRTTKTGAYKHTHTHTQRERERERERDVSRDE